MKICDLFALGGCLLWSWALTPAKAAIKQPGREDKEHDLKPFKYNYLKYDIL